jgi:hypothetical protein
VTLQELEDGNAILVNLLRQAAALSPNPIHLLVDTTDVIQQPSPLETRRIFTYMNEPNLGWTVIAGMGNPMLYFFTKVVSNLVASKTLICQTREHAFETLQRKDPSLPDLAQAYQRASASNE